jgi:BirA family biotin operon repressor/biotin-[acetyl-CoA-carboxylase] ligase
MKNQIAEWTKEWAARAGLECWFAPQTESTNSVAKNEVDASGRSPFAPVLYVTEHQTGGRGRGSNTWTDTSGALLSSWSFHASRAPQPIFAPLAGLAVFKAALKVWPHLAWSMKAPNDIFLGDKKVAGLLIETVQSDKTCRAIVGVGFNATSAPQEIETATSLAHALGGSDKVSRNEWEQFCQAMLLGFISGLSAGQNQSLLAVDAKAIEEALNRRPGLQDKIVKVGAQGELHTARGVTAWQDL